MQILSAKYSETAYGRSQSKGDGIDVEFFLPRMVLKFWNSSLHDVLAFILEEKKIVFALSTKSVTPRLLLS